jgi:hypothetical protein
VSQLDSVRSAWFDTAKFAARLDSLVPVLCAAIELCGIYAVDDTVLLPLTVDPSGLHRRRVWEAWKADGVRCGRWQALAGLGARIRAADLDGFGPYRPPKPLIRRQFPLGGPDSRGMYRVEITDPDDEGYTPPEERLWRSKSKAIRRQLVPPELRTQSLEGANSRGSIVV